MSRGLRQAAHSEMRPAGDWTASLLHLVDRVQRDADENAAYNRPPASPANSSTRIAQGQRQPGIGELPLSGTSAVKAGKDLHP